MSKKPRSLLLFLAVIFLSSLIGGFFGPRVEAAASTGDDGSDIDTCLKSFTGVRHWWRRTSPIRSLPKGHLQGRHPRHAAHARSALQFLRSDRIPRDAARSSRASISASACRSAWTAQDDRDRPFVGSPAYRAGLRRGDTIVGVDGKATDSLHTTEVADLLNGPRGTRVSVTVRRVKAWTSRSPSSDPRRNLSTSVVERSG